MISSKHVTIVALIGLLVLSPITSVVAPAAAFGGWGHMPGGDDFDDPQNESVSEYSAKLDAYRDAQSAEAQIKTALTMAENSVHDAKNRGWLEAEQAFLQAYLDGANESEAIHAGLNAMQAHYTKRQKNLIELQNNVVASLFGIQNSSAHFSTGVTGKEFMVNMHNSYPAITWTVEFQDRGWSGVDDAPGITDLTGTSYTSYPLVNGNTKPVLKFDFRIAGLRDNYNNPDLWAIASSSEGTYDKARSLSLFAGQKVVRLRTSTGQYWIDYRMSTIQAHVYPDDYPSTPQKTTHLINPEDWHEVWNSYQQSYQNNSAAFETWAHGSYQALENGTISAADVLSRLNEMELTANIDWKNATFSEGVVALSSMGLAAPSGSTAYMNISYQTSYNGTMQTTTGLLMSQVNPPDGTWQPGLTYNSSQLGGAQVIMHLDGNQTSIRGDFVINGAYTANGTSIGESANISVTQATYNTTNLTELRQEVLNLSARIGRLRNQTLSTGGTAAAGGSFQWPDLNIPNPFPGLAALGQWIVLAGVIFLALMLLAVIS